MTARLDVATGAPGRPGSFERVESDASERRVRELVGEWGDDAVGLVPCDADLADTAAFCAAYGYRLEDSANTIVVVGKSDPPRYAACVLLATTRLDVNRTVRHRLGVKKASFAGADETARLTGMTVGGVTPLGLPADMSVWVDSQVMQRPSIVLGGGSRKCKVVGPPTLLLRLPGVEVVDGLAISPAEPMTGPAKAAV
jgi:prolyl-tRNA editing enzyme YbaK/EbsC (Cys-tRNA(Pro) deacylase)